MKIFRKKRQGSASFYIVAFSTLILVVIAASFIAVVLSGLTRTENDELSQSAYDAALAGIEDTKVAFSNYQKCLSSGNSSSIPNNNGRVECGEIIYWVKHPDCYMVGRILGRIRENASGEVLVEESSNVSNNMQQAYTCVVFDAILSEYSYTLTESETSKVVRVRFGDGVEANSIKKVKISWGKVSNESKFAFSNFDENGKIGFPKKTDGAALPPLISVELVQTAKNFSLSQFESTDGEKTNRGTVYLVPTDDSAVASNKSSSEYLGTCDNEDDCENKKGRIGKSQIVKTNDHSVKNLPFAVYCSDDSDFACSTTLELPGAIGGDRSNDTFSFVVSTPYGTGTSFKMEFFCEEGEKCGTQKVYEVNDNGETVLVEKQTNQANLSGMQVKVDSTGRANNLFRRVEAVLESVDETSYPLFGVELLNNDNSSSGSLLQKPIRVTSEWNF